MSLVGRLYGSGYVCVVGWDRCLS